MSIGIIVGVKLMEKDFLKPHYIKPSDTILVRYYDDFSYQ